MDQWEGSPEVWSVRRDSVAICCSDLELCRFVELKGRPLTVDALLYVEPKSTNSTNTLLLSSLTCPSKALEACHVNPIDEKNFNL